MVCELDNCVSHATSFSRCVQRAAGERFQGKGEHAKARRKSRSADGSASRRLSNGSVLGSLQAGILGNGPLPLGSALLKFLDDVLEEDNVALLMEKIAMMHNVLERPVDEMSIQGKSVKRRETISNVYISAPSAESLKANLPKAKELAKAASALAEQVNRRMMQRSSGKSVPSAHSQGQVLWTVWGHPL